MWATGRNHSYPSQGIYRTTYREPPQALREPHFRTAAHGHSKSVRRGLRVIRAPRIRPLVVLFDRLIR